MASSGQPFANSIGNAAVSETAQQAIASLDLLRRNDNREVALRKLVPSSMECMAVAEQLKNTLIGIASFPSHFIIE